MNLTNTSPNIDFLSILDNAVLAWALAACGIAQLLKLFFELLINKQWRPSVLLETGGMPSSHSALVSGAAAGIGLKLGFNEPVFALAVTLAFVVMYDASGIRRKAGLIASKVNLIPSSVFSESSEIVLQENLGHTRLEVLIGSLIGPLIVLPGLVFIGSPIDLIHALGLSIG